MHIKPGDKLRGKSENEKLVYWENSLKDIQSKTMGKWRAGQGLYKSDCHLPGAWALYRCCDTKSF